MIRKLLRRLIKWAMAGSAAPVYQINADIKLSQAEELFIRGASTERGRQVIVRNIKDARNNREL